jgi:hypothetical protein
MTQTAELDPRATSTVLPNGDRVPVFAATSGRSVLGVGHLDGGDFVRHATDLLEAFGQDASPVDSESCIIHRYALVVLDENGEVTVQWNVDGTWERVCATTPGAVPITMTEF